MKFKSTFKNAFKNTNVKMQVGITAALRGLRNFTILPFLHVLEKPLVIPLPLCYIH